MIANKHDLNDWCVDGDVPLVGKYGYFSYSLGKINFIMTTENANRYANRFHSCSTQHAYHFFTTCSKRSINEWTNRDCDTIKPPYIIYAYKYMFGVWSTLAVNAQAAELLRAPEAYQVQSVTCVVYIMRSVGWLLSVNKQKQTKMLPCTLSPNRSHAVSCPLQTEAHRTAHW